MKDPSFYVSSLLELARVTTNERRALWRQAMAALARASAEEGPGPLEGLHPDVVLKGVQAALEAGLVEDLDWLSPEASGVALYALAAALPVGAEQRDLGRRVLARMLGGDARTFTAMATVMARSGGKGLGSSAIRARIALVCELPLTHGIKDGPLALALVGRREYAREWIAGPSTRSLPSRRGVAKILERAAREAASRAQMGDAHAFRVFASDAVRFASGRLLADRESLVWRYVAVARGLCAPWMPDLKQQMLGDLAPGLGPTAWRRAVASLAAFTAVAPEEAVRLTQGLVKRGFFEKEDPASAGAFIWGIPRAIEAEPEAAQKLLDKVLSLPLVEVAEAASELRYEHGPSRVVDRVTERMLALFRAESSEGRAPVEDDGAVALRNEVVRDLERASTGSEGESVRHQAAAALDAFANDGALAAYACAREVLTAANSGMSALLAIAHDDDAPGRAGSMARRTSMAVLRDLDASLLERPIVPGLIRLAGAQEQVRASEDSLDAIREQLAEWIVTCETPHETARREGRALANPILRLRRLRTLLHLVDGDLGGEAVNAGDVVSRPRGDYSEGADVQRARRLRALWLRTVKSLLEHFEQDPAPILLRTLLAALARALDAVVRLGVCDVTDALLVLAERIRTTEAFETLAEASMDPDLRQVLLHYARYLRTSDGQAPIERTSSDPRDSVFPPSLAPERGDPSEQRIKAFEALGVDLPLEASARSEALRTVLVRLHGALTATMKVGSLRSLSTSDSASPDILGAVETWVTALSQMCVGARSRLEPSVSDMPHAAPPSRLLGPTVARVLSGAEPILSAEALAPAIDELVTGLPIGIAKLVAGILWMLPDLPVDRPTADGPFPLNAFELPPWLPPRRTLGGFYVVRALGVGGTASVFVVNRVEDRHEPGAERFALKVPDYTAIAARSVSQDEFLKLFREEASALIGLPNHTNLARFVTFDLAARPLPILVMELVEGVTLERVIGSGIFDMKRCLLALDDVLAGLEAMHAVGVGHLDLKPSNVLLRRGEQAVLVDFGLSGRKIRTGCGTGQYGAPEVWGVVPPGATATPMAADVYSFACLAFEMITGQVLFDAPNEVAQISKHLTHDGSPPPLRSLLKNRGIGPLAEVLVSALRQDPGSRPTATALRAKLRSVAASLDATRWPVALG